MAQINQALTLFLSLLVEAIPFLLLGVLFSGLLLLFVDERRLVAAIPKNPALGALFGSLMGLLFPVCECGNVPVARRLLVQGASPAVAVGFLLAAPTVNPIVFWATWTAFRDQPSIAFLRIGFSLAIAMTIGWVFSAQKDLRPFLTPPLARTLTRLPKEPEPIPLGIGHPSPLLKSGTFLLGQTGAQTQSLEAVAQAALMVNPILAQPLSQRWRLLLDNTLQELRDLGGMLVIGSAIATLIQVALPREWILSLGQGPISSIVTMLVMAMVVSICSTVDSFFALSFASTFTSGALLAFLVFGPMIDLKNIGLMLTVFRPRAVLYLFLMAAQMTFLLTLILNLYVS